MLRIRRTKYRPLGPMDALTGRPPPSVHWATSVAPAGNVTGWTGEVLEAAIFPDETEQLVRAFHVRIENAGQLTFEPVDPPVQTSAPELAPEPEKPVAAETEVEKPPEPAMAPAREKLPKPPASSHPVRPARSQRR